MPTGNTEYHRLVVPLSHLNAHFADVYERADRGTVSLFLSAEAGSLFVDQRGLGNVPLGQFLAA
jgi:hypothetical protein